MVAAAGAADPLDCTTTRSLYYGPTMARRGGELVDLLDLQLALNAQVSALFDFLTYGYVLPPVAT